jgi:phosphomannomutase
MRDLGQIIKAYDVRAVYPDQLDESLASDIGAAFVHIIRAGGSADAGAAAAAETASGQISIVIGHDMRPSSVPLVEAFTAGATSQGADVVHVGLVSTDALSFASGRLQMPGAMFTASHNPAKYNGIKLCRAGAVPVGQDTGLREIRRLVEEGIPGYAGPAGSVSSRDILGAYADYLKQLVDLSGSRHLTAVVDAGNGMGGHTAPVVLAGLPLTVVPLFFELDGTFPNHEANPIDPANLRDLQAKVRETGADIGLAFDGDADRCFVVDERGEIVTPSTITALIAERELARHPGATIIHNLITSRTVAEVVLAHGGVPVRTRVGHSFIKQVMAETGAVFGGEHSGHFYFGDFWRADSGMLAALHVLAALGQSPAGTTLSSLLAGYDRYVVSGEINSTVDDAAARAAAVEAAYADGGSASDEGPVTVDHLDGLTVDAADWWFNLRASNTEPLLRLNVEAVDAVTMEHVRDLVLRMVRQGPAKQGPATLSPATLSPATLSVSQEQV